MKLFSADEIDQLLSQLGIGWVEKVEG